MVVAPRRLLRPSGIFHQAINRSTACGIPTPGAGTRAKKREREETGKTGRAAVLQKAGRAPWKTGENHVRGVGGCTYGHTGQKT